MDFLNIKYKNNNPYKNLFSEKTEVNEEVYEKLEKEFHITNKEKLEEIEENIKLSKEHVKSRIMEQEVTAEPFFDEEFLKHLKILNEFFSGFIPNFPSYYENGKVNPRAFLDAKDLLENEFPVYPDEVLLSNNNSTGTMNPEKMHFENGYSIDPSGNVYNADKDLVFNHGLENEKVKYVDLINNKVITDKGLRIELPKTFLEDFFPDIKDLEKEIKTEEIRFPKNKDKAILNPNEYLNPREIREKVQKFRENADKYPKELSSVHISENVYGSYNGHPISWEEKYMIELPLDNVYLKDIFEDIEKINFAEEITNFNTPGKQLGICNFKDIPYGELSSLLLWGGGQRGVKPLSSNPITDKDIIFAKDGTAKYSNIDSSISISRMGCSKKTYKTGHVCMWTSTNRLGLKRSIIQYIYLFCNMVGLFNANIPMLLGFKKIRIFGGICIGGLLERLLCSWQERLSKRINEMFQCIPAPLNTDLKLSGFENATFPYGATVEKIEDLNNIKAVKFGDRFVVNLVPKNITGGQVACGVFIFDPNSKLKQFCPWRYNKVWAGKPFNERDNFQMVSEFANPYNNPIIQDIITNSNALGEDSISRKLMSLLHAFIKKQELLESQDVVSSIEVTIENGIHEALQGVGDNFGPYQKLLNEMKKIPEQQKIMNNLKHSTPGRYSGYGRDKSWIEGKTNYGWEQSNQNAYLQINGTYQRFFNHFAELTQYGFKIPPKKKRRISSIVLETVQTWRSGRNGGWEKSTVPRSVTYEKEFYDISGNPKEYLIPTLNNMPYYDSMLFAHKYAKVNVLKDLFKKNMEILKKTDPVTWKNYRHIRTIRDYLIRTDQIDEFMSNLKTTIDYVSYDLNINGYDKEIFQQCMVRVNAMIDNISII